MVVEGNSGLLLLLTLSPIVRFWVIYHFSLVMSFLPSWPLKLSLPPYPPTALLRYNWPITLCKFKMWWSDTCIHCEMFTTIKLVNTSFTSCNSQFCYCHGEKIKGLPSYQLSNIQYGIFNCSHHSVCYIPRTYKWKSVLFDQHLLISSTSQDWVLFF